MNYIFIIIVLFGLVLSSALESSVWLFLCILVALFVEGLFSLFSGYSYYHGGRGAGPRLWKGKQARIIGLLIIGIALVYIMSGLTVFL